MWLARSLAISLYIRQASLWCRATGFVTGDMPTTRRSKDVLATSVDDNVATTPKRHRVSNSTKSGTTASAMVTPSPASKKSLFENDKDKAHGDMPILFTLDELVRGTLVARPSKRNKSPFVADVYLEDEQREAIVHVPSLDMCGKCVPGTTVLIKPARTNKGELLGPDAVSPKYGTPKCEFTSQLILVDDQVRNEESARTIYTPTWVGAHPSIGERVTEHWLQRGLILQDMAPITSIQKQYTLVCEDGTSMRPDFLTTHADGTKCLIEVKTVVDTDYYSLEDVPSAVKDKFRKNLVSTCHPYVRTALFPSGGGKQKGPDGENVVSSRAIKHVQELTRIVQRSHASSGDLEDKYEALVVFCVVRGDAEAFRANHIACPSFAKYLKEAKEQGVRLLAKRTSWDESGACFSDKELPILWTDSEA